MKINLVINAVNLVATAALVYGFLGLPRLGVLGAGIATSIARMTGALLMAIPYLLNRTLLSVRFPRDFRPEPGYAARIMRIGVPGAIERVLFSGGMLIYSKMVAGLGTLAFAAHTIGINAESISYMPGSAFGTAATTVVGQRLGAKRPDQAERGTYIAFGLGAMFVSAMAVAFLLIPGAIIGIYTKDPEVIRLASVYLRMYAFCQIHQAGAAVFSGALKGAGDTRFTMLMAGLTDIVVLLGGTWLLVDIFDMGIVGAWLGMAIHGLVRAVAYYLWFRTGRWKEISV